MEHYQSPVTSHQSSVIRDVSNVLNMLGFIVCCHFSLITANIVHL
jgi:hypothetical protein